MASRETYTQQLRTDSLFLVIPLAFVIPIAISVTPYLIQASINPVLGFSFGQEYISGTFILIANGLASALISRISWEFAKQDNSWLASRFLIISSLLLVSLNFLLFWSPGVPLPYIFSFYIVVSSTIIRPPASFYTWFVANALMLLCVVLTQQFNVQAIVNLFPPMFINLILAFGSFATSMDWELSVNSASEEHLKAQRRRDELFAVQEELKRTDAKRAFLYTQLATSMAVGQRVVSILDMNDLLSQVAELIRKQFSYGYVGIFLVDEDRQNLYIRAQSGHEFSTNDKTEPVPIDGEGVISHVARQRKLMFIDDMTKKEYLEHPYSLSHMLSEAAFPLVMGGRLVGVMDVQSYQIAAFTKDNIPMLQALADQVATAIQNAVLYRQQEMRYQLTETLGDIGRAISSTLDLDQVLHLILENLARLVKYNRAAIMLHRQNTLEMVASRGFPEANQNLRIPIREADDIFMLIYNSKQPLAIPDVTQHPSWTQMETLPSARAWLGIPFIRDETVTGMLSLAREAAQPYTKEEIELATTFASQASVALENARLFNRTKRFNEQLEYEVQQRTVALTEAYDQLERLDRAKSDFIGVASHELRTPLTILRGYSDMLRHDPTIKASDYYRQLVEGIHSGAARMHEIVNDMLDVVKIDSRELNIVAEPLDMRSVIQSTILKLEQAMVERKITVSLDELPVLPHVEADIEAARKVFYHLMMNAIKYTPDGGKIFISGKTLEPDEAKPYIGKSEEAIQLTITDTGIGIDPKFHDLIFTKFYQTGEVALHSSGKTKFKGGGPGLGLAIVRGIVIAHHGSIWVESPGYDEKNYPGSSFHLVFPLHQAKPAGSEAKPTA